MEELAGGRDFPDFHVLLLGDDGGGQEAAHCVLGENKNFPLRKNTIQFHVRARAGVYIKPCWIFKLRSFG